MTLCIAWADSEDELYFAADSRLTLGNSPAIDSCAKIVRLPVRIRLLGTESSSYEWTIGLAFAGSFITAYTVREILLELLPLTQVVEEHVKPSLQFVVSVIARVFEDVCREVTESLFEAGSAELLVGGYCPVEEHLRLFHIAPQRLADGIKFLSVEKSLETPLFIGSGAAAASNLAANVPNRSLPAVLRDIIRDNDVPTVGGPIQIGKFEGQDFKIFGIQDYEIRDGQVVVQYLYRGVKVRRLVEDLGIPYAHFATSYLAPFLHDIDKLVEEGNLVKTEQ